MKTFSQLMEAVTRAGDGLNNKKDKASVVTIKSSDLKGMDFDKIDDLEDAVEAKYKLKNSGVWVVIDPNKGQINVVGTDVDLDDNIKKLFKKVSTSLKRDLKALITKVS